MRLIPLHNEQQVARWAARHIVDSINRFSPTKEHPLFLAYRQAVRRSPLIKN